MTSQSTDPRNNTNKKSSFKMRAIAACAVGALAVGAVGVGALDTLRTSINDNTSTVEGAHVYRAVLNITGDPFQLRYAVGGTVSGASATTWSIVNSGDGTGTWDGVFKANADADPTVAAATRISVDVPAYVDMSGLRRTTPVKLDLGTLAAPVSLQEAWAKWVGEGGTLDFTWEGGDGWVQRYLAKSALREGLAPRGKVTLDVTPSFDSAKAAAASTSIKEGDVLKASGSFDVTYLG